jgi:hypothetical protein
MPRLPLLLLLTALSSMACRGQRTCSKMQTLCGTDEKACGELRDGVKEKLGDETLAKFDTCFLEAKTCAEASGCTVGVTVQAGADAVKGFFDGVQKGLEKK